jgi:hypothetical protein
LISRTSTIEEQSYTKLIYVTNVIGVEADLRYNVTLKYLFAIGKTGLPIFPSKFSRKDLDFQRSQKRNVMKKLSLHLKSRLIKRFNA